MKKIGEAFTFKDQELITVANIPYCGLCFTTLHSDDCFAMGPCSHFERSDRKDVIFMPVQDYIIARMKNA